MPKFLVKIEDEDFEARKDDLGSGWAPFWIQLEGILEDAGFSASVMPIRSFQVGNFIAAIAKSQRTTDDNLKKAHEALDKLTERIKGPPDPE